MNRVFGGEPCVFSISSRPILPPREEKWVSKINDCLAAIIAAQIFPYNRWLKIESDLFTPEDLIRATSARLCYGFGFLHDNAIMKQ